MVAPFAHQWHAEPQEFGVRVCRGTHAPTQACRWEYFAPTDYRSPGRWITDAHRAHGPAGEVVQCFSDGMPDVPLADKVARLLTTEATR